MALWGSVHWDIDAGHRSITKSEFDLWSREIAPTRNKFEAHVADVKVFNEVEAERAKNVGLCQI